MFVNLLKRRVEKDEAIGVCVCVLSVGRLERE